MGYLTFSKPLLLLPLYVAPIGELRAAGILSSRFAEYESDDDAAVDPDADAGEDPLLGPADPDPGAATIV